MVYGYTTSKQSSSAIQERIAFLDSLRAIAIIMVVGVHTLGYCRPLPELQKIIISFFVHTIAVPVFFLVDGYLFARSIQYSNNYRFISRLKKSAFRLLAPWLIFTLFYLAARYCFELFGVLDEKLIINNSFNNIILSSYGSVYAPQMYFLASLFLIRLCGPFFKKIVLIKSYIVLFFFFACFIVFYKEFNGFITPYLQIEGGQEPVLHAAWGAQYYFLGIVLFKVGNTCDLKRFFSSFFLLFLILLLLRINGVSIFLMSTAIQYAYLITIFLLFFQIKAEYNILFLIGRNTMGIFLIHAPIILKGVSIIFNRFLLIPILNYLSILLATFLVSLFIAVMIKKTPYGSIILGENLKHT